MHGSVSLFGALLAGLISFVSPCVLPIVPGYLSFISGINVAQLKGADKPEGLARPTPPYSPVVVSAIGFSIRIVWSGIT